jgi:hypothetical protein
MRAFDEARRLGAGLSPSRGYGVLNSFTVMRLSFFILYYALNVWFAADTFLFLITFPTFAVCYYNISKLDGAYATSEDMIWLVIFIFFVIAPCQTIRSGYFENDGEVSGIFFRDDEIETAAAIMFVFLFVATVTNIFARLLAPRADTQHYELNKYALPVLLVFDVLAFAMVVVFQGGISNVLAERLSKEIMDDTSGILGTAATSVQMVASLLTCVYAKCKPQKTAQARFVVRLSCVIALFLLLICQNPFNTPRFYLMIAWFPIILVFVSGRLGVKGFYLAALSGLVIIMPMLNYTSRFGSSLADAAEHVDMSNLVLKIPGLDVFDMLVFEVRYLQSADYFWGGKALGLLFFFVPRSIWTWKEPTLAGDMGARLYELGTAGTGNLSMFVAGDFYADLGLVGVAIGAVLVSLLLTVFGLKRPVMVHGMDLRAFIFMSSIPILVRGALGAVLALTFVELIILAVLTRVLGHYYRTHSNERFRAPTLTTP